jgi:hypothetical protein
MRIQVRSPALIVVLRFSPVFTTLDVTYPGTRERW